MARIEIKGVDKLQAKLRSVNDLRRVLEPPMQRSVLRLQRDMADYPPPPPRSTYRRTGTLGRRWTTRVQNPPGGLQGKVGNNTRYAPWVQSRRFQAGIHRGRWQTDEQVTERNRQAIIQDFNRTIQRELDK